MRTATRCRSSVTIPGWCAAWMAAPRTCTGCGSTTLIHASIDAASAAFALASGPTCAATSAFCSLPTTVLASLQTLQRLRCRLLSSSTASSSRRAPPGSNSTWLPCTPVVGTHRAHCTTVRLRRVQRQTRLPSSCSAPMPRRTTPMLQLLTPPFGAPRSERPLLQLSLPRSLLQWPRLA